jgi:hypothetical protein
MDIASRLAIFRAGQHTAVDGRVLNFTAADLEQIATSYDAQHDAAPMVVGHPSLDAPAYGWAKSLRAENGVLYAEPDQVDAQFAEMVNAGRFKKISSSIYLPDSPGNPKPGQFYLRHIGFLGAAAPAVKGLKPASFGESKAVFVEFSEAAAPMSGFGARVAQLFRALRTHLAATSGADLGGILPDDALDSLASSSAGTAGATTASFAEPSTEPAMPTTQAADFAEREKQLKDQTTALEAREKAIAENEKKIRRTAAVDFAEQLVKDGKILPREKAPVVELLLVLPADSAPLSFAEGETTVSKPAAQALRELLTGLPKRIEYGRERTADTTDMAVAVSFAAPDNVVVDAARLELLAKTRAYQAAHPNVSYVDAVRACGG